MSKTSASLKPDFKTMDQGLSNLETVLSNASENIEPALSKPWIKVVQVFSKLATLLGKTSVNIEPVLEQSLVEQVFINLRTVLSKASASSRVNRGP